MVKPLWENSTYQQTLTTIDVNAWRMIEAQEVTATRKLVNTYDEQVILEDLIETSKPTLAQPIETYHPLLYTPFRYPPLKHGSRFGKRTEPSLWYGSLTIETAMAEKAFYQFNFLRASEADFGYVQTPLTAFSTPIKTHQGLALDNPPYSKQRSQISSPTSYEASQTLGSAMREHGILAFTYFSARGMDDGINVGLFSPNAFGAKAPHARSFQSWQCLIHGETAEFTQGSSLINERCFFTLQQFTVNDVLPFPSA